MSDNTLFDLQNTYEFLSALSLIFIHTYHNHERIQSLHITHTLSNTIYISKTKCRAARP